MFLVECTAPWSDSGEHSSRLHALMWEFRRPPGCFAIRIGSEEPVAGALWKRAEVHLHLEEDVRIDDRRRLVIRPCMCLMTSRRTDCRALCICWKGS